jgi:uncharacterized ion transporter superfamily protein YfcC
MEHKAGAQISARSFLQSGGILFALMILAGILTRAIPAGNFTRLEVDGREVIDPATYLPVPTPDYPVWRWLTAPIEVLWGPDALTIITIIVFLLMVGVAFAVLEKCGLLKAVVGRIVRAFEGKKYLLLVVISLFFMLMGTFFGIFEEVVPLVPLMLALSYSLGWDSFVGLGMSILAVNMGFSAAITNPFTIGVAQRLAGLPLFSGAWYRLIIFAVFFVLYIAFMIRYARKIERNPLSSSVYHEDQAGRERYSHLLQESDHIGADLGKAIPIFLTFLALILVVLVAAPFIAGLSDYSMPIVGLLFLIGAFSAALVSSAPAGTVRKAALEGLIGIAPAIPLILMAVSVKHIVMQGGILDTILNMAAQPFSRLGPSSAALLIFVIALLIEFFIASGSAKAFLLMPILVPLADLVGVTRQVTVTAYCFGDGFSNMAYPTNPVLLISLMLCAVSFPKWLRWLLGLWVWVLLAALFFLSLGVVFNYGPF